MRRLANMAHDWMHGRRSLLLGSRFPDVFHCGQAFTQADETTACHNTQLIFLLLRITTDCIVYAELSETMSVARRVAQGALRFLTFTLFCLSPHQPGETHRSRHSLYESRRAQKLRLRRQMHRIASARGELCCAAELVARRRRSSAIRQMLKLIGVLLGTLLRGITCEVSCAARPHLFNKA